MKEECKIWMRWQVKHEYYRDGLCRGMELQVNPRSWEMLRRRGLRFDRRGGNEWVLWGGGEWCEEDEILLELKVTDHRLFYATEGDIVTEYRFGLHESEEAFVLDFKSKRLFWEYILLVRVERERGTFELSDATGKLTFKAPEQIEFMDRKALRIETTEAVLLCEQYDYQLRLYEHKILGRKLICGRVVLPDPEEMTASGRMRKMIYF